jgi:hypothetical protein
MALRLCALVIAGSAIVPQLRVLASVEDKPTPAAWYGTSMCREHDAWHWALAEPAVDRWGFLQQ